MQDNEVAGSSRALIALQKQKAALQSKVAKLNKEKDGLLDKVTETVERTRQQREKKEALERSFKKIQEVGINDNDRYGINTREDINSNSSLYIYFLYLLS